MTTVLIIRLSALGDVAMLVPVLYSAAKYHPNVRFVLLTKNQLFPIFEKRPANVDVFPVFAKGRHKGIGGLFRLINDLSKLKIDQVADMHLVLRSLLLRTFFFLKGKKIAFIQKGRTEKKHLTRKTNKLLYVLTPTYERYRHVFSRLGYDFPMDFEGLNVYKKNDFSNIEHVTGKKNETWIGIAPFAKHTGKIYPIEKMDEVIRLLAQRPNTRIFLFGGKNENFQLQSWEKKYKGVSFVSDQLSFSAEIELMSCLDVMITMDSGNMHLASLTGIPVVSIWGATHPSAGFYGYQQELAYAVQIELSCRPCSVYGNKSCYRKDYICLHGIKPEMVIDKVEEVMRK